MISQISPVVERPSGEAGSRTVWVSETTQALDIRLGRLFEEAGWTVATDPAEATTVIWAAAADPERLADRRQTAVHGFAAALGAAEHASCLVLVSSAMVYGAWANNPVPLVEDAPLRPAGDFGFARQLGALEQMADDWRVSRPGRRVAVLRPVVTMAADASGRLPVALAAGMGHRRGEDDSPAQFVHLDDVASAVLLAADRELDGVFNVAPDGWVAGERVRALAGATPRIKLPERLRSVIDDLRWRFTRGPIPPGLAAYTRWPWLVANDRLKAAGWRPTVTNEQAYVEGTEQRWWTMISPKRRQEATLGGLAVGLIGGVVAIVVAIRRARHRRADEG